MTDYFIFRQTDEKFDETPGLWEVVDGVFRASSAKRALDGANLTIPGEYVAVPVRSWKPLKVSVEQTTKVTIG